MTMKPVAIRYFVGTYGSTRVMIGISMIITKPPGDRISPASVAV